ncbi:MAG: V-type ATP synthase subunit D [Candidatus Micrarchaeota archaeon]|nr:V-type ATP synthase subunit D [Candidatus Micrarchaeota archaeon]
MISPTRMNLIIAKRRKAMAKKGYNVLKRKQEVLVMEFLRLLKQSRQDRSHMNLLVQRAYESVTMASAYVGDFELESASMHVPEAERIGVSLKGIMGVQIPEIIKITGEGKAEYNLMSTSIAVDDINESFNVALESIIGVAQRELGLKRLVLEVEKVKRRVNALDYRLIPDLEKRSRYISMRLEEIERDSFAALKHVKKRLEKAEQAKH